MNGNSRGFCIFYDWFEAFEKMPLIDVAKLVLAIGRYYRDGSDEFDGISKSARLLAVVIQSQIDRARKRKKKIATHSEGEGDLGGGVNKAEAEAEAEAQPKAEAYVEAQTDGAVGEGGVDGSVLSDGRLGSRGALSSSVGVNKPTLFEIKEYIRENGIKRITPEEFYDCNEERGWRVDGEPVRDWRRLIDSWERKRPEKTKGARASENGGKRYGDFDVNEAFLRGLERSYGEGK